MALMNDAFRCGAQKEVPHGGMPPGPDHREIGFGFTKVGHDSIGGVHVLDERGGDPESREAPLEVPGEGIELSLESTNVFLAELHALGCLKIIEHMGREQPRGIMDVEHLEEGTVLGRDGGSLVHRFAGSA